MTDDSNLYVAINNCFEKGAAVNLETALNNGSYGNDPSVNLQGSFQKPPFTKRGFSNTLQISDDP
jgi:hypothetical protein